MKKLLAIILFFLTTAINNCFPWKTVGYRGLQTACWLYTLRMPLMRCLLPVAVSHFYPKLTDPCALKFIHEQLQRHGLNPTTTALLTAPNDLQGTYAGALSHNLLLTDSLVKQIDQEIKQDPSVITNPMLGKSAIILAHEFGHIKYHHNLIKAACSAITIPAIWYLYKRYVADPLNEDPNLNQKTAPIKNEKLRTVSVYLKKAFLFVAPFAAAELVDNLLTTALTHLFERQADTYAFTHAPSPLALCAFAAEMNDPQKQCWNTAHLLTKFFSGHPAPLSRANRALDCAQKNAQRPNCRRGVSDSQGWNRLETSNNIFQ